MERFSLCLRDRARSLPATGSIGVARKLGFVPDGTVPYGGRTVIRYVASMPETPA
jgi:hypothetical protein